MEYLKSGLYTIIMVLTITAIFLLPQIIELLFFGYIL